MSLWGWVNKVFSGDKGDQEKEKSEPQLASIADEFQNSAMVDQSPPTIGSQRRARSPSRPSSPNSRFRTPQITPRHSPSPQHGSPRLSPSPEPEFAVTTTSRRHSHSMSRSGYGVGPIVIRPPPDSPPRSPNRPRTPPGGGSPEASGFFRTPHTQNFYWYHGGEEVKLVCSLDAWVPHPMVIQQNKFTVSLQLEHGKLYQYRFIVDGEPKVAPEQDIMEDVQGHKVNFVEIHIDHSFVGPCASFGSRSHLEMEFSQQMPPSESYIREPPLAPPHLRDVLLNHDPISQCPHELDIPQHIGLNHVMTGFDMSENQLLGDIVSVASTQRFREKFVTTIYARTRPQQPDDDMG